MNANISTDRLVNDLKAVAHDAEDLLKAREARVKLGNALERAKEAGARLEEKALAGAKATDKVIRDHP